MCLKKYCECFQAGVSCSGSCACINCYNTNKPGVGGDLVNPLPVASSYVSQSASPFSAGTPSGEGEEGIARAAEYLSILQNGRGTDEAKKDPELGMGGGKLNIEGGSRPPLPGGGSSREKRKRENIGLGLALEGPSTHTNMAMSFTPIYAGSKNQGIASAEKWNGGGYGHGGSHDIPVFSLRSASPNSINIASALSLLSGSHANKVFKPTATLVVKTNQLGGKGGINSFSSDATTSEDDSYDPSPSSSSMSGSEMDRKDSIDSSSNGSSNGGSGSGSDSEAAESMRWGGPSLVIRGVAIAP
jgi:hypothetical protein